MIGDRISTERAARGWSMRELAELSGISENYLWLIEKNRRPNPTIDTLQKIAGAFGLSVDALLNGAQPIDTSKPPVDLWEALHWPKDLVSGHIENWADYSESERLEFIHRARRLYEEQEALQAQMRQRKPAI